MPDSPRSPEHEALNRAKSILRLKSRAARRAVLPELRTACAYAIAERVLNLPEIASAAAVMVYGSSEEEVDVGVLEFALRERGTRIAFPRVAGPRELSLHWVDQSTPPATLRELSALIVPGVAFDAACNRLGFGGGFYDTLLATVDGGPVAIGVAYDEQVVREVPHDTHDRPMDIVVTPTRTYRRVTTRI